MSLYHDILSIINEYINSIKILKQIDNNKVNNDNNNDIPLNVFGVPWRADDIMQNRLIELKKVTVLLSESCTKLAILIVKKLSNEVIDSIVIEIKKYIELLYVGFIELQQCLLCDPLFYLIKQETVCILVQIKDFIDYIIANNFDNSVNILAGMISERSDSMQKFPMSNKAAYRRSILECISVTKDTVQEFETYIQESNDNDNNGDDNNGNDNDDNDDNDEMDFGDDDVNYSSTEIITVSKCLSLIKSSLECMKVALAVMTCVGDNVTNSKLQRDTTTTTNTTNTGDIVVNDLDKPLLEMQCDEWIVKVHRSCKLLDSSVLNLGGELYPPVTVEDIDDLYIELSTTLQSTIDLLQSQQYQSMLSMEVSNTLQNFINLISSLPKSLKT
jgi:hypothetical protein